MPTELKVLASPSMQKKYDFCYLLGQLQYLDRWEPREAERSLPARLRGTAFARAAEIIHKALMGGERDMLDSSSFIMTIVDEACAMFDRQFQYCVSKGIVFPERVDEISRAELRRTIPLYARHTPVRSWKKILGVEYPIKKYSCRPDIVGINELDFLCVGDVKYKSSLEARYETNTVEEFKWDPQFLQYNHAWRADQGVGDDVPVYSTLLLVVGSPFRIKPVAWLYTPENLQIWLQSATALTETINSIRAGTTLPRAATVHKNNYGWCPMKKACLEYNLDPELMKRDYVQLDELPE